MLKPDLFPKPPIRGFFELQHVTTYFRFGSDTDLNIISGDFQEWWCIDGRYMDCDYVFNAGVGYFYKGFNFF